MNKKFIIKSSITIVNKVYIVDMYCNEQYEKTLYITAGNAKEAIKKAKKEC